MNNIHRKPFKVGIYRQIIVNERGHYVWYPANYDEKKHTKDKKPKLPVFNIFDLPFQTEKQFVRWIYENWGEGTYLVMALRGQGKGFIFWRGEVSERGFIFWENRMKVTKREKVLKKEMAEELMERDLEMAKISKEEIEDIRKEQREAKPKRYGFKPYLRPSGKRGYMILWSDSDNFKEEKENWGINKKENKSNLEDWGNVRDKEFEKW